MNWYTYAGNNPLRFVDPTGMTADENENNDFYTIPTFVPFKYNNNALDWLKVVPNACTYMVNDAIGLANAAIVDVQYIKKRGIRNYLGVAWEQTKQQASNIGASVKNTIAYHVNTPPAEQLSDAKDVLSNPDTWARASATAGEMYLAGKAMKSLGKSKVKSGGNKAGIKGAKASSNSKTAATKTDFYVTPSGEANPQICLQYMTPWTRARAEKVLHVYS